MKRVALIVAPFLLVACAPSPRGPTAPVPAPTTTPAAPPQAAAPKAPAGGDAYSRLVARAEAGDDKVDFLEMRMAYLDSPAFAQGRSAIPQVHDLRTAMFAAMSSGDYKAVNARANETLGLVYIDLEAQKARYQSCAKLGDEACAARGKRIELSLLKSVVSPGNGLSCARAWKVVRIDEEYFVLRMLDMKLTRQSLVQDGGRICDKMEVTDETGKPSTYYFDVGDMLKAEEALLTAGD
jgi:hypothetical protein